MNAAKPFAIDKWRVYEAYQAVKANAGAAGVDKQTIADFEKDLKDNLYKIWNRMSSGSYFPPPVKAVAIPKRNGGERILGVPTVADRVAQMGKQNLANLFATMILLAFLVHTTLDLIDAPYRAVRNSLPSRRTFFEHLRALIQYLPFDDWDRLMRFMLKRLDHDPPDTS